MMRALVLAVFLLGLAPAARAASSEEEAGDVSEVDKDALGPLRERIPPVTGHLFLKRHRFELSPAVTFSVKDAFFSKYVFGLSAAYHLSETFAVNGRFGYSIPTVSGAAEICIPPGSSLGPPGCNQPTLNQLNGIAPGAITLIGGVDLEWAPLYGKIALSSEYFAHFDIYGILGPSLVQYTGPGAGSTTAKPIAVNDLTAGGNVGLGLRAFMNKWLAVRLEFRDLIYAENVVIPTPSTSIRNQLMFEVGFSMFFPTAFQEL
jgi:outer membrane beta-barrel protein